MRRALVGLALASCCLPEASGLRWPRAQPKTGSNPSILCSRPRFAFSHTRAAAEHNHRLDSHRAWPPLSPATVASSAIRRLPSVMLTVLVASLPRRLALASGGLGPVTAPAVPLTKAALLARMALWIVLFSLAALFAGAD